MDKVMLEALMLVNGERFGEEVGKIVRAFAPENSELLDVNPVANPMISHVHGFGMF
jgi:hypothetical protein